MSVRQRNTPGPIPMPLGDRTTNILGKAFNGQQEAGSAEDSFIKIKGDDQVKHKLQLHRDVTPTSAESQASTDGDSICETLSDVCLSSSASSSCKSTAFSSKLSTSETLTMASAQSEVVDTPQATPSKQRNTVPSLEVIAARLKRTDLCLSPTFADQENNGIHQQHSSGKISENSTPIASDRRPTLPRGRSGVLASLVDRASQRSRSVSPTKRQPSAEKEEIDPSTIDDHRHVLTSSQRRGSVKHALKEVPSLQEIIKRMSGKKESNASNTASTIIAQPSTPPRTPVKRSSNVGQTQTEVQKESKKTDRAERAKSDEHPLEHKWTLYFDSKTWNPSASQTSSDPSKSPASSASSSSATSWEATLKMLGQYDTVEKFMTVFRTLRRPSQLERNSNYHLFKNNIKPMWEDPANTKGGKWVITLRNSNQALLDRSWMWLVLALIGEEIDDADDICGAVVSTRTKGDRIALWLRDKSNVELVNKIGKKFVSVLDLEREPGVSLEFSANMQEDKPRFKTSTSGSDAKGSSLNSSSRYIGFSNAMQSASQNGQPQHTLNATHPGSPIQVQGTLGAHLRLHSSPSKNSLSSSVNGGRRRDGSFSKATGHSSNRQDPDSSFGSMSSFSIGLGGPIGRTSSPSPASSGMLRSSTSSSLSGGLLNRNSVKIGTN